MEVVRQMKGGRLQSITGREVEDGTHGSFNDDVQPNLQDYNDSLSSHLHECGSVRECVIGWVYTCLCIDPLSVVYVACTTHRHSCLGNLVAHADNDIITERDVIPVTYSFLLSSFSELTKFLVCSSSLHAAVCVSLVSPWNVASSKQFLIWVRPPSPWREECRESDSVCFSLLCQFQWI